jgi:hypothetical protein
VLVLDHLLGVVPRGASQCWRAHSDPGRIIELLDADDALQPRRRAHLDARVGEDKNEIDRSFREMVWLSRRRPLPERF